MSQQALGRHAVSAQIFVWRHGWVWPVVLSMIAVSVALEILVAAPAARAVAAAQAELVREAQGLGPMSPPVVAQTEIQKLEQFQDFLRQAAPAEEVVRRMAALARAERISLSQGDYVQQHQALTKVVQVQITQPVRAPYPQLRGYIDAVLLAVPNASLDQISARRDNVAQSHLEARLRWSVWVLPPEPAASAPSAASPSQSRP